MNQKLSRMEQILNLLIEEIQERIGPKEEPSPLAETEASVPEEAEPLEAIVEPSQDDVGPAGTGMALEPEEPIAPPPEPDWREPPPAFSGPLHAARLMGRLALGLLIAVVLINIPFNRHGTTLATAMPDAASFIVRDGLVVKEEDDEEIYVYQDGQFRWISSLDAFEHYGYTWEDVHIVPDGYLERYEFGSPIHVLLKCQQSPHIYRLEKGEKRWIRDIDTFVAEGHVWEDVRFVSCQYLRGLPDGETIPPDSGPPPQP